MFKRSKKEKGKEIPANSYSIKIESINQLVPVYQLISFMIAIATMTLIGFHTERFIKLGFFFGSVITSLAFIVIYLIHNYRSNKPLIVSKGESASTDELVNEVVDKITSIDRIKNQIGFTDSLINSASEEDKRSMFESKRSDIFTLFKSMNFDEDSSNLLTVIYINCGGSTLKLLNNIKPSMLVQH